jgi:hypothetical protein
MHSEYPFMIPEDIFEYEGSKVDRSFMSKKDEEENETHS